MPKPKTMVSCACGTVSSMLKSSAARNARKRKGAPWRCAKCAMSSHMATRTKTTEQWVKEAKAIHGDRYDYSSSVYVHAQKSINVACPEHGVFQQGASSHLRGDGCPECAKEDLTTRLKARWTPEFREKTAGVYQSDEFKAKVVANWKDPEKAAAMREQRRELTKGFWQRDSFRRKVAEFNQPPISSLSRRVAEILEDWNVWYELEYLVDYYRFDVHVPSRNLVLELNGEYWHSLPKAVVNDRRKATYLRNHRPDLRLVTIWEREFEKGGRLLEILAEEVGVDLEKSA